MKILDFRKLCPQAQEEIRKRAVNAVLAGRSQLQVAENFGVSKQAICIWLGRYRSHGERGLRARSRGTHKKGGKLAPWEAAWTAKAIQEHYPERIGLPFYVWSRGAVAMLIEKEFGVSISARTAGRYLQKWNFTAQVPMRQAYQRSPEEVEQWLHERYPEIVRRAKRDKGIIFFADQVGFHSTDNYGRSYGRRGKTPTIPSSGQRFHYNIVSALTNLGRFCSMGFAGNFSSTVFMKFLRLLTSRFKEKIYLVIDKHPVHIARKVSEWLLGHAHRISAFFLPGYSPELNPDELFNNDIKANCVGRTRPHSMQELIGIVKQSIRRKSHCKVTIASYFHEQHVTYAAA